MSKELVISANRHETKVAILEDDQLVEVFFQRANEYSLAGSIHKGRVTRVLPGMQSAFVDLGLDRDTFLYVSDFFEEAEEFDRLPDARRDEPRRDESRRDDGRRDEPRREREGRPTLVPRADAPRGDEEPGVRTEPEVEAAGQPSEGTPLTAPSGPRREDDGRDRDRRGRSRRRRNRGRGFPDSKYASSESRGESRNEPRGESRYSPEGPRGPRVVETPAPAESREEAPAAASSGDSFSVLPGESLAKYSRSNIAPLDDAEEAEIRELQDSADEVEAEVTAVEEEAAPIEVVAEVAIIEEREPELEIVTLTV